MTKFNIQTQILCFSSWQAFYQVETMELSSVLFLTRFPPNSPAGQFCVFIIHSIPLWQEFWIRCLYGWTLLGWTTCFCDDQRSAESHWVKEAENVFNLLASLNLQHGSSHIKQIITRVSTTLINESTTGKINRLHLILNCRQVRFLCGNWFSHGTK